MGEFFWDSRPAYYVVKKSAGKRPTPVATEDLIYVYVYFNLGLTLGLKGRVKFRYRRRLRTSYSSYNRWIAIDLYFLD